MIPLKGVEGSQAPSGDSPGHRRGGAETQDPEVQQQQQHGAMIPFPTEQHRQPSTQRSGG